MSTSCHRYFQAMHTQTKNMASHTSTNNRNNMTADHTLTDKGKEGLTKTKQLLLVTQNAATPPGYLAVVCTCTVRTNTAAGPRNLKATLASGCQQPTCKGTSFQHNPAELRRATQKASSCELHRAIQQVSELLSGAGRDGRGVCRA